MADIGDSKYENDRSNGGGSDDCPETPHESTASISDTEEEDANAHFDGERASRIEELGDEEELPWQSVHPGIWTTRKEAYLGSLHVSSIINHSAVLPSAVESTHND